MIHRGQCSQTIITDPEGSNNNNSNILFVYKFTKAHLKKIEPKQLSQVWSESQ